ncbi:endolytic transglycosylase MltG [Alishewanella tabrizica]|uniref:Endolytic murein transglycosylase n=1 Tax=Alishewanella tabrizica TaxID=671278 RepID=A0ABQ2WJV7_9ALTE|nr:endolytic transglycosylase MltG [Alishewanella tabrizica]GGW60195.1 aminodeoxychorismate lyase [Alishewanella tabrizica]
MLKRLLAWLPLIVVMIIVMLWSGWKQLSQQTLAKPLQFSSELYELKPGTSVRGLCRLWQQQHQVTERDCLVLKLHLKQFPHEANLQQGVYRVPSTLTLTDALALFRSGKVAQFSVTLIEGETLAQSWQRIAALPYLEHDVGSVEDLASVIQWPTDWGALAQTGQVVQELEGLFYPDTYFYTANSKASAIWQRAHEVLKTELTRYWQQRHVDLPLQNPYELLIMASIIEKESGLNSERGLVSSVFMNRINTNMRLQTDPTVIYGLTDYTGRITRANLRDPHRYNTYRHHGLPPGPISLVSRTALIAAAQPAQSDYFYFVSRGDGSHVFSQSLEQHNAAVRKYILGQGND